MFVYVVLGLVLCFPRLVKLICPAGLVLVLFKKLVITPRGFICLFFCCFCDHISRKLERMLPLTWVADLL